MCLAIPSKVLKINNTIAEIETLGVQKEVDISLVPDVKIGDYVIVHAGFAIQIIDKDEALLTRGYWNDYFESAPEPDKNEGQDHDVINIEDAEEIK